MAHLHTYISLPSTPKHSFLQLFVVFHWASDSFPIPICFLYSLPLPLWSFFFPSHLLKAIISESTLTKNFSNHYFSFPCLSTLSSPLLHIFLIPHNHKKLLFDFLLLLWGCFLPLAFNLDSILFKIYNNSWTSSSSYSYFLPSPDILFLHPFFKIWDTAKNSCFITRAPLHCLVRLCLLTLISNLPLAILKWWWTHKLFTGSQRLLPSVSVDFTAVKS